MTAVPARAFVLGGGVAGLTAAFGLADRGYKVTLLESRGWLGGRAFSSLDRDSGRRLDNGPHVMLGCYRATRALLRRLGTEEHFQQDRALALAYRCVGGRVVRLQLSGLPVPLAMPLALLRLAVPFGARVRAFAGMVCSLLPVAAHWTLAEWLRRRRQDGEPAAFLWRPLCRAIMNVEPEQAAARDFLATLREAFSGRAGSAAFWTPKRPWGALFGDPAPAALAAAGVELRLSARVATFELEAGRVRGLGLLSGERLAVADGDLVVSALPWFALRGLLPSAVGVGALQSSPIMNVFVRTRAEAPLLPDEGTVVALVEGDPFHFVMRTAGADPREFALVSGGNRSFDGQSVDEIRKRALQQIERHYPGLSMRDAEVRIRKEQHATFVASCGSAVQRPRPGRLPAGPDNLLVCGDWTATGLPSTLEGAARSAEALLRGL